MISKTIRTVDNLINALKDFHPDTKILFQDENGSADLHPFKLIAFERDGPGTDTFIVIEIEREFVTEFDTASMPEK